MQLWAVAERRVREDVEDDEEEVKLYFDEKTGQSLDQKLGHDSRREELSFMRDIGLIEEATLEGCMRMTGRMPISTKWVDVNKGTEKDPEVRCRLVARDFKPKGENTCRLICFHASVGGDEAFVQIGHGKVSAW